MRKLFAAAAAACLCTGVAGCATPPGGGTPVLNPTAQAIVNDIGMIGWPLACAEAEKQMGKVKKPTQTQVAAIASVTQLCSGPMPADLATAQADLAKAAATFAMSLVPAQ